MADANVPPPFEAYVGTEPYLFVGYCHADAALVFPELARLRDSGYRIWYDEGIDPGAEWPEYLANALNQAALILVFLSPNAVNSRNVRNEINFSLNNNKRLLTVHLLKRVCPVALNSESAIYKQFSITGCLKRATSTN